VIEEDVREVTVRGLTLDPVTNAPIVILKPERGARLLPIWIGVFEANAIALEMEKVATPRPMTHDLVKNLLEVLGAEMARVVVDNLRENTFYASIYLRMNGQERRLDARPSDAIAIALRAGAPIFVTQDVLSRAQGIEIEEDLGATEQWRQWLERIKPEDFGRFTAEGRPEAAAGEGGDRADG
jgi:hypothetical protein